MTAEPKPAECKVIGGEKLPSESGGADALCAAIAVAAAEQAPGIGYNIEVRVLPRSRLAATVMGSDGRKLAETGFASMDKPLTTGSFKRFAAAIAQELAKTRPAGT
ncbi:MAG TPA: hypothetical protein VFH89_05540 [Sphingomicrobium sp.]|nr:hypothetical protein [Sphingomicrobium sp.]